MTPETHTILIVEEDPGLRAFLHENLGADGFVTVPVREPEHALATAATQFPDAAIVSVNGGSGRSIVAAVRDGREGVDHRLPVLLIGRDRGELEVVRNLNLGADDYLAKPFSYAELLARLRALLRRVELDSPLSRRVFQVGEIRIDTATRSVHVGDRSVDLSKKVYALLVKLASEPERVFTKEELLRELWGRNVRSPRTLDAHACRLRHALSLTGYVQNVWGVGYRLMPS